MNGNEYRLLELESLLKYCLQYVGICYDFRVEAEEKFIKIATNKGYEMPEIKNCIMSLKAYHGSYEKNFENLPEPELKPVEEIEIDTDNEATKAYKEKRFNIVSRAIDLMFRKKERNQNSKETVRKLRVKEQAKEAKKIMEKLTDYAQQNKKATANEVMLPLEQQFRYERERLLKWLPKSIINFRCCVGRITPFSPTLTIAQAKALLEKMQKINANVDTEISMMIPPVLRNYKEEAETKLTILSDDTTDDTTSGTQGTSKSLANDIAMENYEFTSSR